MTILRASENIFFGDTIYASPVDFTATFVSATSLALVGLPFTPSVDQIMMVMVTQVTGRRIPYAAVTDNFGFVPATGILTIPSALFAATDLAYRVIVVGPDKAYSKSGNYHNVAESSPLNLVPVEESLADTTNVGPAAVNYPSDDGLSMLGFKSLSLTGKLIDADATISFKVYGTNDEDAVAANRDWIQLYGFRSDTNTIVNLISCPSTTVTFGWDFDNLNYKYVRVTFDPGGGATNTVILKARRSAL